MVAREGFGVADDAEFRGVRFGASRYDGSLGEFTANWRLFKSRVIVIVEGGGSRKNPPYESGGTIGGGCFVARCAARVYVR